MYNPSLIIYKNSLSAFCKDFPNIRIICQDIVLSIRIISILREMTQLNNAGKLNSIQ